MLFRALVKRLRQVCKRNSIGIIRLFIVCYQINLISSSLIRFSFPCSKSLIICYGYEERKSTFPCFFKSFHSKEDCLRDKRCLTIATKKKEKCVFFGLVFPVSTFLAVFRSFSRVINFLHRMLSLNRVKNNNQLFLIHPVL